MYYHGLTSKEVGRNSSVSKYEKKVGTSIESHLILPTINFVDRIYSDVAIITAIVKRSYTIRCEHVLVGNTPGKVRRKCEGLANASNTLVVGRATIDRR